MEDHGSASPKTKEQSSGIEQVMILDFKQGENYRESWISENWGTAVAIQAMVSASGHHSGAGVMFTHDPRQLRTRSSRWRFHVGQQAKICGRLVQSCAFERQRWVKGS